MDRTGYPPLTEGRNSAMHDIDCCIIDNINRRMPPRVACEGAFHVCIGTTEEESKERDENKKIKVDMVLDELYEILSLLKYRFIHQPGATSYTPDGLHFLLNWPVLQLIANWMNRLGIRVPTNVVLDEGYFEDFFETWIRVQNSQELGMVTPLLVILLSGKYNERIQNDEQALGMIDETNDLKIQGLAVACIRLRCMMEYVTKYIRKRERANA